LTIQSITALLGVLAWPLVAQAVLVLLRREITGLFGWVREIEGAGTKVSRDPTKVEQIIEQGRMENSPLAAVAKRIVQSAVVLEKREARILRALLDDDGRAIYSYQTAYYGPFRLWLRATSANSTRVSRSLRRGSRSRKSTLTESYRNSRGPCDRQGQSMAHEVTFEATLLAVARTNLGRRLASDLSDRSRARP
jgi:hypothetical protein